ncbi:MAG: Holliday junction resolvase RuvX [Gemmatimonadota bacterium]|nr:Holliday junction resolvase RuvX [Gemmatimonadota bacterium]
MATSADIGLPRRWVGVDYGKKRVGIAVADPLRMFAQPLGTYSQAEALQRLREIDEADGLDLVVIGWPLMPDGEEGLATELVAGYIKRISKALPNSMIVKWDERYTSAVAAEKIREAGPNRKWRRNKGRVDSAAAALILQEYLDDPAAHPA